MIGEEHAELVTCQHSPRPAQRVRHSDGQAVGVGVVRQDEIGTEPDGIGKREVECSGFFRVGERDRREVRVGCTLSGDDRHRAETGLLQELRKDLTANAVQRRVHDPEPSRARGIEQTERRPPIRAEKLRLVDGLAAQGCGTPKSRRAFRRGDGACHRGARGVGDDGVARRYQLGAVCHVDLVSVVGRRVVACSDHHARSRTEVLDGKSRQGGRKRTGKGPYAYTSTSGDYGDVAGEFGRSVAGVATHDNPALRSLGTLAEDPLRHAGRRGTND